MLIRMVPTDRSVTHPSLFVGTPSLRGDIGRYAKRFNMLEVSAEPGRHPKRSGLVAFRNAVPPDFVFSVVPPAALSSLEASDKVEQLVRDAESVAEALGATWWVLRTPPSVTPSARSLRSLQALVDKLRSGERRIAWEPRGIWRDEEAADAAASLGITLVRDLLREDPVPDEPIVYTRIRALGEGAHVGSVAAERIAERLSDAESAYVVVEGTGAVGVRKVLREAFGLARDLAESGDEDEGESDEDEQALDDEDEEDEEDSFE